MNDKGKCGGVAALVIAILGLLAFIGFTSWAVIGVYMEVQTSKRVSRERSEKVLLQLQERERAEAVRQLSAPPLSESP